MSCEPALLTIVKQATLVRDQLMIDNSKVKRGIKVATGTDEKHGFFKVDPATLLTL